MHRTIVVKQRVTPLFGKRTPDCPWAGIQKCWSPEVLLLTNKPEFFGLGNRYSLNIVHLYKAGWKFMKFHFKWKQRLCQCKSREVSIHNDKSNIGRRWITNIFTVQKYSLSFLFIHYHYSAFVENNPMHLDASCLNEDRLPWWSCLTLLQCVNISSAQSLQTTS